MTWNFDQIPSMKIETDPAGPADQGSGLCWDPKRDFEGVRFLWDLIGNSALETIKFEDRARWHASEESLMQCLMPIKKPEISVCQFLEPVCTKFTYFTVYFPGFTWNPRMQQGFGRLPLPLPRRISELNVSMCISLLVRLR